MLIASSSYDIVRPRLQREGSEGVPEDLDDDSVFREGGCFWVNCVFRRWIVREGVLDNWKCREYVFVWLSDGRVRRQDGFSAIIS